MVGLYWFCFHIEGSSKLVASLSHPILRPSIAFKQKDDYSTSICQSQSTFNIIRREGKLTSFPQGQNNPRCWYCATWYLREGNFNGKGERQSAWDQQVPVSKDKRHFSVIEQAGARMSPYPRTATTKMSTRKASRRLERNGSASATASGGGCVKHGSILFCLLILKQHSFTNCNNHCCEMSLKSSE